MTKPRLADHVAAIPRGGAFHAALQIARALEGVGVDWRMWHDPRQKTCDDPRIRPLPWSAPRGLAWLPYRRRQVVLNRRWRRATRGRAPGLEPVHPVHSSREIRFDPTVLQGDVLHLHWIGGAMFDWEIFFASLPPGHPVVWTQHDFHAFTGGCSYPGACDRYLARCEACPHLLDPGPRDLAAEGFSWKARHYPDLNLHLVAPSSWLYDGLRQSALGRLARSVHHIPYPYALDAFLETSRAGARARLGLAEDAEVVAFGADSVTSRRKGAAELLEALGRLQDRDRLRLVVFGGGDLGDLQRLSGLVTLGSVATPEKLATVYAAADVFCLPSLEDNLPLTGLEALASGTPIVTFDGSGAVDYVIEGETGWRAAHGSAEGLASALVRGLDRQRDADALAAEDLRAHVRAFCDPERRAREYLAVYDRAGQAGLQNRD